MEWSFRWAITNSDKAKRRSETDYSTPNHRANQELARGNYPLPLRRSQKLGFSKSGAGRWNLPYKNGRLPSFSTIFIRTQPLVQLLQKKKLLQRLPIFHKSFQAQTSKWSSSLLSLQPSPPSPLQHPWAITPAFPSLPLIVVKFASVIKFASTTNTAGSLPLPTPTTFATARTFATATLGPPSEIEICTQSTRRHRVLSRPSFVVHLVLSLSRIFFIGKYLKCGPSLVGFYSESNVPTVLAHIKSLSDLWKLTFPNSICKIAQNENLKAFNLTRMSFQQFLIFHERHQ